MFANYHLLYSYNIIIDTINCYDINYTLYFQFKLAESQLKLGETRVLIVAFKSSYICKFNVCTFFIMCRITGNYLLVIILVNVHQTVMADPAICWILLYDHSLWHNQVVCSTCLHCYPLPVWFHFGHLVLFIKICIVTSTIIVISITKSI